ncbi:hypothetical protein Taro_019428 [Colocasia esculenta]|uniref:Uncharacterized protein n=1 Tax=Colocasia esculenta TaxID=4460 RepID=A0A843UTR8_COLES|nr:hypothetical protein [Colocasia esculenta]
MRKTYLCKLKSDHLKLVPTIYYDKEVAGTKGKASPTSSCGLLHQGTRRKASLGASWDCPRRASPAHLIPLESFLKASLVGDVTPVEEAVESDSERGDYFVGVYL